MTKHLPSRERLDRIANGVVAALAQTPGAEIKNAEGLRMVVRAMIVENLREEAEIEQEAIALLRAHGQKIYEQGADFEKLVVEGKRALAKKKGFVL